MSGPATAALERVRLAGYKSNSERQSKIAATDASVAAELEKFEQLKVQAVTDLAARMDAHRTEVDSLATEASALSTELLGGLSPDFRNRWQQFEARAKRAVQVAEGLRREKDGLKAELADTLAAFDAFLERWPDQAPIFS